jgi:hypothetical protein
MAERHMRDDPSTNNSGPPRENADVFDITINRSLRMRSDDQADLPMPLDDDGFLDDAIGTFDSIDTAQPGDLLTTLAACEAQVMLILGEPGLGKSMVLSQVAEILRSQCRTVVNIDGADLTEESFDQEIRDALFVLGPTEGKAATPSVSLIVDSLDESPLISRLPRRLLGSLETSVRPSLQLVLGCRTADVPADLIPTLRKLFKGTPLVVDLTPLRRSQAISLASSAGVDGMSLVATAIARGAGSMAAAPLTLGLLVREYAEKGGLDSPPRELFERGICALLETTSTPSVSSLDQRRAVAERIAAITLLTGKRTIFVGRNADATPHDLRDSQVADGTEMTPGGGHFAVTPAHVRETIATALFGGRGPDRVAFVHASQAAFLAACFLARQEPPLPREQLRSLLLVAAPDGAESVPTSLREVGAWLAAMSPAVGDWLARVDPESLVGHESYLDSPQLRSLVVESLLDRASEFELGNRYWFRGLHLAHPQLADQIVETLAPFDRQPVDYPEFARCRVALRLAEHAQSAELTVRLLEIARSQGWNAHLGSLAVEALLNADGIDSQLRDLLRSLDDREYARRRDSDDEMRGHLLVGLWPGRVALPDVLMSLRPRQSELFGSYWRFLREFPQRLTDNDLPEVMRWAASSAGEVEDTPRSGDKIDLSEEPIGRVDSMLTEALVGRALKSSQAVELLREAARLTWPRLDRYDHPGVPEALDEHQSGKSAHLLRRAFVEAMVRERPVADLDRADVWHLASYWRGRRDALGQDEPTRSRLVDSADFGWATERQRETAAADPLLSNGLAQLGALLFNASDPGHVEIAWNARDTPLWTHISHWFDAVDLGSPLAERLRETASFTADQDMENPDHAEHVVALRSDVLAHYEAAVAGETDHFWRLAHLLQFEPDSTRLVGHPFHDRVLELPGAAALPASAQGPLTDAALQFLITEHDYADDWLGSDRYDRRGWAGYLALALLDEVGSLGLVPKECWARWCGAILWFWTSENGGGDPDLKGRLLSCASADACDRVATLFMQFVRGELRRGGMASEVESFPAPSVLAIKATWIEITRETRNALLSSETPLPGDGDRSGPVRIPSEEGARSNARFTLELLVSRLAKGAPIEAERLVLEWLGDADNTESLGLAARAAAQLIAEHPTAWQRVGPVAQTCIDNGRAVALALSNDRCHPALESVADESELIALHQWLATLYPPEHDPPDLLGARWVSPEAHTIHWRDDVLSTIADRATERGFLALAQLRDTYPTRTVVLSNLIRARIAMFGSAWSPPSPADFQGLITDHRRRLVRSAEELGLLILEAVHEIQGDLARTGQLLWDQVAERGATPLWRPKPEAALSAFVAHELRLRLVGRGVAVNQEVLVKPTDAKGSGLQPDILIEAVATRSPSYGPGTFRVAAELKGSWHDDVLTAQDDQLASQYLPETNTKVGLYIVGWYPLDQWDRNDGPRKKAQRHKSAEALGAALLEQANELRARRAVVVTPVVLTIPAPALDNHAQLGGGRFHD